MWFVFGLQTLSFIDFIKIFQLKGLKPKNKDHMNFYECCDLTKKVYLMLLYFSHLYFFALKRALCVALLANWFWAANKNYDRKLETTQGRPQRRLSPYGKNLQKSSSLEIVCLAGFFIVTKTKAIFPKMISTFPYIFLKIWDEISIFCHRVYLPPPKGLFLYYSK